MSVFLLEKSAEHLERGLVLAKDGNVQEAKYNLFKAAEYLFKAAEQSEAQIKGKRLERAEAILKRARTLEKTAGPTKALPIAQAEDQAGMEWLVAEKPDVRLDDVAGIDNAKEQIRVRMIYPFTRPDLAKRFGIKTGGGLLFYGPPGTGKTMLAKAVAGEIDAAFFTVRPSDIMSKWVGEAEQNISKLFSAAKQFERAIIFIDEVEALIPKRSGSGSTVMQRVVPQILTEMEGFGRNDTKDNAVLFIGATNEPWALDPAAMRPGRFDEKVYIPLPNSNARLRILDLNLKDRPISSEVSLEEITQLVDGYSGADIRRICEKASEIPFIESVTTETERIIERRDFLAAIEQTKPSVSEQMAAKYDKFAN